MQSTTLTRHALAEHLPKWGIKVLESHHSHDFIMEWRKHSFLKIVYTLAGKGTLCIENDQFAFEPKDILVVPRDCQNRIVDSPSSPSSLYILCLSPSVLQFDASIEKQFSAGTIERSEFNADKIESLLRRLLFYQSNSGQESSLAIASAALNILQLVIEGSKKDQEDKTMPAQDTEMKQYLAHLDSHFYEAQDIGEAAKRLGISRRSFTQRFREAAGVSWLDYVRSKAIDHAANLLLETNAPIASVAFESGFSDLSTFYRHFKARRGVSPSAWRKKPSLIEDTEQTKSS